MPQIIDTSHLLPVGTILHETYRIEAHLASGGFGNTYKATHLALGEIVAIKEFYMANINMRLDDSVTVGFTNNHDSATFNPMLGKFRKEARRIHNLCNPHIVKVSDLFDENRTSYYVMEYIDGESLGNRLNRCGALSEQETLGYVNQILDALNAIHDAGIYHLDIKPDNIMVDKNGQIKLIDFGASKQPIKKDGQTATSTAICYTPGFAAPEVVQNYPMEFGPWTDFFSLGATMFYLITTMRPPTSGENINKSLKGFKIGRKTRLAIVSMLNNDRTKRPANEAQVRAMLKSSNLWKFFLGVVLAFCVVLGVWYLTTLSPVKLIDGPKIGTETSPIDTIQSEPKDTVPPADKDSHDGDCHQGSQQNLVYSANGITFTMVEVRGGTFMMGATSEQNSDTYSDEYPPHYVTLSNFRIGQTEVTQELWKAVMGNNPSHFQGDLKRPVENVSWNDCQRFINRLNSLTGKHFRLPTEAEWEFAARGGNNGHGYKYSGSNTLGQVAWYWNNIPSQNRGNNGYGTQSVGKKNGNELGLYDMSGNVHEWCQDYYGEYSNSAQTNPTGPGTGGHHIYRGGSWGDGANGNDITNDCRVSRRNSDKPDFKYITLGLRLAL